ncbi:hypothetical protein [Gorillibacterium sp. sgz5001074]|uniref:hypothetical protein n=1 Tax=Gorillibacterium sp. sgz5001074 TaxID=3446695 RepID=UPI003F6700E7
MKLLAVACFSLLITSAEYLSSVLGVFVHVTLKVWWSAAFWLVHNLILVGVMRLFRSRLPAGGAP